MISGLKEIAANALNGNNIETLCLHFFQILTGLVNVRVDAAQIHHHDAGDVLFFHFCQYTLHVGPTGICIGQIVKVNSDNVDVVSACIGSVKDFSQKGLQGLA